MPLDSLRQDLRYAIRNLRTSPGFAMTAVLTLGLGIGATTMMISVIYHVLFAALPYRDIDRSVVFKIENAAEPGGPKERRVFTAEEFRAFQQENHVFDELIGWRDRSMLYDDGTSTRVWRGVYVTSNTFTFLSVPPIVGRSVTSQDGEPTATPVFVMNHRVWQTQFGADPGLLGKTFSLNGEPRLLVAVMPPSFDAFRADVWLPSTSDTLTGLTTPMGRLRRGVTVAAATADLDALAHRFASAHPQANYPPRFSVVVQPFLDTLVGGFKKTLYVLLGAVALLLLIACSNVANLLLTRATVREREMAIRASLGATRGRLLRQLCIESLVLASLAALVGCALASGGLRVLMALLPPDLIPAETVIRLNGPVLLLSLAVTVATAVICSIAPALHVRGRDLRASLAASGKGAAGDPRHGKLRGTLVVAEVALSMVLLTGAGLLLRSFFVLTQVDLGFTPANVLYVRPWFPKEQYDTKEKQNVFTQELLQRMKTLPHVVSVGQSMLVPPLTYDSTDIIIPGKPHTEPWNTALELCDEGFFETLGVPLRRGRLFSAADVVSARQFAVVNESFARQYFPNEDPLGKSVRFAVLDRPFLDAPHNTYFEIIGIVADYKTRAHEWQTVPQAFLPYSIQGFSFRTFLARTSVDPALVLKSVQREVWAINPHVGIRNAGTIADTLQDYYRQPRFRLLVLGSFATVSLALVIMGVFSLTTYIISLRSREIGLRMALGAERHHIVRLVLTSGLTLVAVGIALGGGGSFALSRVLASEISGVSVTDPWAFGAVATIVFVSGLLACAPPARRAIKVDPMAAVRAE